MIPSISYENNHDVHIEDYFAVSFSYALSSEVHLYIKSKLILHTFYDRLIILLKERRKYQQYDPLFCDSCGL